MAKNLAVVLGGVAIIVSQETCSSESESELEESQNVNCNINLVTCHTEIPHLSK